MRFSDEEGARQGLLMEVAPQEIWATGDPSGKRPLGVIPQECGTFGIALLEAEGLLSQGQKAKRKTPPNQPPVGHPPPRWV